MNKNNFTKNESSRNLISKSSSIKRFKKETEKLSDKFTEIVKNFCSKNHWDIKNIKSGNIKKEKLNLNKQRTEIEE